MGMSCNLVVMGGLIAVELILFAVWAMSVLSEHLDEKKGGKKDGKSDGKSSGKIPTPFIDTVPGKLVVVGGLGLGLYINYVIAGKLCGATE